MATPEIPPQYLRSGHAPTPRTLIDILYDTAGATPTPPAIDDGEVQLTYAEMITDIEAGRRDGSPTAASGAATASESGCRRAATRCTWRS